MNLTRDEQFILENLLFEYKYIARDLSNDNLCVYHEKPKKTLDKWECETKTNKLECPFKHLFKSIKWEDEEPVIIFELLKQQRCKRNL